MAADKRKLAVLSKNLKGVSGENAHCSRPSNNAIKALAFSSKAYELYAILGDLEWYRDALMDAMQDLARDSTS